MWWCLCACACVCRDVSACVSVGIRAFVSAYILTETDTQMSFLINQMLLIYNQIFLLLLIWQFSQTTTVLTCFCFAFILFAW